MSDILNRPFMNSNQEYESMGDTNWEKAEGERLADERERAEAHRAKRAEEMRIENEGERLRRATETENRLKEQILEVFLEANPNYNEIQAKVIYDRLREIVALGRFERAFFGEKNSKQLLLNKF